MTTVLRDRDDCPGTWDTPPRPAVTAHDYLATLQRCLQAMGKHKDTAPDKAGQGRKGQLCHWWEKRRMRTSFESK